MTRHRIAVLAAAVSLSAAGCRADTEAKPPVEPPTTSASAATETSAPLGTDPLEPLPADQMLGQIYPRGVVRAEDGTTLVVSSTLNDRRSVYRLYDRRWAPLTPMLELRGSLTIDRGLAHAFLGVLFAYRDKGQPRVDERVSSAARGR